MPLVRIVRALLEIALKAAYFGLAHRLLPPRMRVSSSTFLTLLAAFCLASLLRHNVVGGSPFDWVTLGFFVAAVSWVATERAAEAALYLAASIGVDLTFSALGALGVDINIGELRALALVWEGSAALVAIVRLHKERGRSRDAV